MKYAYYVVASNDEQKESFQNALKEQVGGDEDFYAAYIEVAPEYNGALQDRRAWRSLQAAVRKGKIQILVIQDMDNLHMGEYRAYSMLKRLMDRGVQIALKNPRMILSVDELLKLAVQAQADYFMENLAVPLLTMENCLVHAPFGTPFICLGTDPTVHDFFRESKTMCFEDVVEQYQPTGFYLYRTDKKGWYHIDPVFAREMHKFYNENLFPF